MTIFLFLGISEYYSSSSESSTSPVDSKEISQITGKAAVITSLENFETSSQATTDSELVFSSASKLRKVSEQLLNGSSSNSRTRSSMSGPIQAGLPASNLNGSIGSVSRPGSIAPLTNGSPRDPKMGNGGPGSIGQSSSSGSDSRPASRMSLPVSAVTTRPNQVHSMTKTKQMSTPNTDNYSHQKMSYASPANTVGLPQINHMHNNNIKQQQQYNNNNQSFNSSSNTSLSTLQDPPGLGTVRAITPVNSKIPRLNIYGSPLPAGPDSNYLPEAGGLLSTISQAALSDDESPPTTHVPSQPKFNTASLARTTPNTTRSQYFQPNYENLESAKQQQKYSGGSVINNHALNNDKQTARTGIPRKIDLMSASAAHTAVTNSVAGSSGMMMTQGQYRAAASQATVATIPEEPGAYLPMASRKGSLIPLATSSPSGAAVSSSAYAGEGVTLSSTNGGLNMS